MCSQADGRQQKFTSCSVRTHRTNWLTRELINLYVLCFAMENRSVVHPSFLSMLVHMWADPNSADCWDRRQTWRRNTGAHSPPPRSQWLVIWPFNICCRLSDLCTAKRDLQNAVCHCSPAKNLFFFPSHGCIVWEVRIEGHNVDLWNSTFCVTLSQSPPFFL